MLRRAGAVAISTIVLLTGCQQDTPSSLRPPVPVSSPSSTKTRVIGLVGTMTGPDAWRGEDAWEGAHLSVNVLNRSLREREPDFELVTLDDGGDAGTATRLVQELAGSDRTVGLIYAGPDEGLPGAEEALGAAGIPALTVYGDLYSARLLSAHVFQVGPPYLWQARTIARYLLNDRRYRRIGLLSEDSLTGQTARRSMTTALSELGGSVTASALLPNDPELVGRALKPLGRKSVSAVVVQASPQVTEAVLAALKDRGYRYRTTKEAKLRPRGVPGADGEFWHPQIIGFDTAVSPDLDPGVLSPGLVAADTYARGAHYLPIPSFERFHSQFADWWEGVLDQPEPLGFERRSFEAVQMIGWAARRAPTGSDTDVAGVLEKLRGERFGGLDVTFGPDDHTSVDQTTVGLWVIPRPGIPIRERSELPSSLPWVPLGRGFSIDLERTDVLPQDWKWLFRNAPPKQAPAPKISRALFGVSTGRKDPVH